MTRTITIGVILVSVVFLGGWDLIAVIFGGEPATISSIIQSSAHRWPVIPFLFGVLMGHFFASSQ